MEGLLGELDGAGAREASDRRSGVCRAANIYKLMVGSSFRVPSHSYLPSARWHSQSCAVQLLHRHQRQSAGDLLLAHGPRRATGRRTRCETSRETGEFVVNVVSEEFAEEMNMCSAEYPPEVDEFGVGTDAGTERPGATAARGRARASMECRLLQVVHVSPKPLGGSLVLGEVLRFHVDECIVDDFKIDPDALRTRSGAWAADLRADDGPLRSCCGPK